MLDPILVTGFPRSGCSLVSKILALCGGQGGRTLPNRGTHSYEDHATIQTNIIAPLLDKVRGDGDALPTAKAIFEHMDEADTVRRQIVTVMLSDGVDVSKPWYVKDTRLIRVWPIIHSAFPRARWLIARRDAKEIVDSCMATGSMRWAFDRAGWKKLVEGYERRFKDLSEDMETRCRSVWISRALKNDWVSVRYAVKFVDLEFNKKAVTALFAGDLSSSWYPAGGNDNHGGDGTGGARHHRHDAVVDAGRAVS